MNSTNIIDESEGNFTTPFSSVNSSTNTSSHFDFRLSNEERILTVLICLLVVLAVVITTVLIVTECCWLKSNKCCRKSTKTSQFYLQQPSYLLWNAPPSYNTIGTINHRPFIGPTAKDSAYGSLSLDSQMDMPMIEDIGHNIDEYGDTNFGQITFSVRFLFEQKERTGQLYILLKEAQDLPAKSYGGACDPYVVIKLYMTKSRRLKIKENSIPFCIFQSNVKKKTRHPLFMETFVVSVAKADIKGCVVKFLVYDREKFANDTELGECITCLKDYQLLKKPQIREDTIDLIAPKEENGKLCFGLSYLPTAERLTFTIIKANHLKLTTDNPAEFAPYVRVLMLRRGKIIQKRKTTPCRGSSFPVFNEVLTFDLPSNELDNVVFIVAVIDNKDREGNSVEDECLNIDYNRKKLYIGKVVLGATILGRVQDQWNAMKQSPRKLFTYWHILR